MRHLPSLLTVLLLGAAAAARAQGGTATTPAADAALPDTATANVVDVGIRGTIFGDGSDQARFQRYRDLRNGVTLEVARYTSVTATHRYAVRAEKVGYRDQRYSASADWFGKLKIRFDLDQIPLFFSNSTRTLHADNGAGLLLIDDGIQSGIQGGQTNLAAAVGQATPFDMRLRRTIADFSLTYQATDDIDIGFRLRNTMKRGSQPWGGTFGFANAIELAVPVDTRTTEVASSLEWSTERGSARIGYDGSFFSNSVDTLTWDNPLRITDGAGTPAQGRMALWPDSTMNAASAMGALNLARRTRLTGYVSLGAWTQNAPLIPFTINSALAAPTLARDSAEAKARVTAMNYTFTSRPTTALMFNARYRSYDFDNQTPELAVDRTVSYDSSVAAFAEGRTSPYSLNRKTFLGEAAYSLRRHVALKATYGLEAIDQDFRYVDSTTEHSIKLTADLTGHPLVTLRGGYEHAVRTGTGFDEQVLDDLGEQVSLRQFDISDRTADRGSLILMVMPLPSLAFNGNVTLGRDERPDTVFGLLTGATQSYAVGVDYVPRDAISVGASYVYDRYGSLQRSRQANPGPQFEDPTRDWTTDVTERADTFMASMDLIRLWPRTEIRSNHTWTTGDSRFVYGLAPNTTLPAVVQLPDVNRRMQRTTVDTRYFLNRRTAIGLTYAYDAYRVSDYAQGPQTLTGLALPSFLIVGYTDRPYTANMLVGRLSYFW